MHTIKELKAKKDEHTRAARHLVAEMGSKKWSPQQQNVFDTHVSQAEAAQAQIEQLSAYSDGEDDIGVGIFMKYLRHGQEQLSQAEMAVIRNTMSTTTGSEGGFTVTSGVAAMWVDQLKGYGFMRRVARQTTTTTGANLSFPTTDGTAEVGEFLAQNANASNLDASFGTAPIPVYHFGSKVFTVPIELLQDSAIDVIALVLKRARDRIGRAQNPLFTTGSGTGQPLGLVSAAAVGLTGAAGQTLTVTYDNLADLVETVDEAHLGMPDAAGGNDAAAPGWMFSKSMRKTIRKIKDSNGRPIWLPAQGGDLPQLLDFPVYINNDMPVPAANAKSIAFGNLASYMIRDVQDVKLLRFADSAFTSKGQVGFLGVARSGGTLLDPGSVKLYQHSAT